MPKRECAGQRLAPRAQPPAPPGRPRPPGRCRRGPVPAAGRAPRRRPGRRVRRRRGDVGQLRVGGVQRLGQLLSARHRPRPSSLAPYDDRRRGCRATGKTRRGCRRSARTSAARHRGPSRGQIMRRRLVALGSIVVVVVAVIIVLTSSRGRRRRQGCRQAGAPRPAQRRSRRRRAKTKLRIGQGHATRPRRRTGSPTPGPVPILEYHDLGHPPEGAPYPELYVGRTDFEKQMDWLEERGLRGGDARTGAGSLVPRRQAAAETDRPLLRRRLPPPVHLRPADPPQARLGGRPQPQGGRLGTLRIERRRR